MLCLRLRFDLIFCSSDMVRFWSGVYVFLFPFSFFLFPFFFFVLLVYYLGRTVLVFVEYGIPKPKLFCVFCWR